MSDLFRIHWEDEAKNFFHLAKMSLQLPANLPICQVPNNHLNRHHIRRSARNKRFPKIRYRYLIPEIQGSTYWEIPDFFGPKWHSLRSLPFQGPKKSRFQGPPLQTALVMDFPPSKTIRPAPYKRQVH
jgi:hypothetical protein